MCRNFSPHYNPEKRTAGTWSHHPKMKRKIESEPNLHDLEFKIFVFRGVDFFQSNDEYSFSTNEVRTLLTEVLDIAGWPKRRFYEPRLAEWQKSDFFVVEYPWNEDLKLIFVILQEPLGFIGDSRPEKMNILGTSIVFMTAAVTHSVIFFCPSFGRWKKWIHTNELLAL